MSISDSWYFSYCANSQPRTHTDRSKTIPRFCHIAGAQDNYSLLDCVAVHVSMDGTECFTACGLGSYQAREYDQNATNQNGESQNGDKPERRQDNGKKSPKRRQTKNGERITLTPSTPAVPNCCCSKDLAPYWSNPSIEV